jgi:hypothetical protein
MPMTGYKTVTATFCNLIVTLPMRKRRRQVKTLGNVSFGRLKMAKIDLNSNSNRSAKKVNAKKVIF